jgi:hypothetical protein
MSYLRKFTRARRRKQQVEELFAQRADRYQHECGWCGKAIGQYEPVMSVGAKTRKDIDLSQVEGKVIEVRFEIAAKNILVGVTGFDSLAKQEGHDVVFMTCSEACGRHVQAAFTEEVVRGLTIN